MALVASLTLYPNKAVNGPFHQDEYNQIINRLDGLIAANPQMNIEPTGLSPKAAGDKMSAGEYNTIVDRLGKLITANNNNPTTPTTPAAQAPTVTGFTPYSALVGASVTLSGTGFTGATAVTFNGTPASFSVLNATTISATVPTGASSGKVQVATSAGTGQSAADFTVSVPAANVVPVANAGSDTSIQLPTNQVVLQGAGTDSDGSITSYAWRQITGPNTASGLPSTVQNPVAGGLVAGTYQFGLITKDDKGASSPEDFVVVTVNAAPAAGGGVNQFRIAYPGQSNEHSQGLKAPFLTGGHLAGITPAITREFQRSWVVNGSAVQKLKMGVNDYNAGATAVGHPDWFGDVVTYSQAWENAGTGILATARYSLDGSQIEKFTKQGIPLWDGGYDNSAYQEIKRQILVLKAWWLAQGLPLTAAEVVWDCNQGETWADLPNWKTDLAQIWADLAADCGLPTDGRESVTLTASQTDAHDNTQARANIQSFADSRAKCLAVDAIGYNLQDEHHWDALSHLKHSEEKVKALRGVQPTKWFVGAVQNCGAGTTGTPQQRASTVSKAQANTDATAALVCTPTSTGGGGGTTTPVSNADPDYPYLTLKKQEFTQTQGITVSNTNTLTATGGIDDVARFAKARYAIGNNTTQPIIGYFRWKLVDVAEVTEASLNGPKANGGINNYIFGGRAGVPRYDNELQAGSDYEVHFGSYVKVSTGNNGVNQFGANLYSPNNNPDFDIRAQTGKYLRLIFEQTRTILVLEGATRAQDIILSTERYRADQATIYQSLAWFWRGCRIEDIWIAAADMVDFSA
ncbi:hypothetical protein K3G63_10910 [Hymenobacter sp. HSC-4F20]|uniref:PKD domain-containing protein n=1 Tax=Hymenobacter sp. HSC-4F20 TaxID=2864135 RepID=UPI001C73630F|nr:IPT/TIG domain-containing protein [Hymenobacter sp. HSC-4F20]MBX0290952.1 hypothetical protein [Hymenobacter sp. HSC-4F20]